MSTTMEQKAMAFLDKIDYAALAEQKADLATLIEDRCDLYGEDDATNESLLGILHLLDALTDLTIERTP